MSLLWESPTFSSRACLVPGQCSRVPVCELPTHRHRPERCRLLHPSCLTDALPPRAAGTHHSFPSSTIAIIPECSLAHGRHGSLRAADSTTMQNGLGRSFPDERTGFGSDILTQNSLNICPVLPEAFHIRKLHPETSG